MTPAELARWHMDTWMAEWRAAPWWRPLFARKAWWRAVQAAQIMGDLHSLEHGLVTKAELEQTATQTGLRRPKE